MTISDLLFQAGCKSSSPIVRRKRTLYKDLDEIRHLSPTYVEIDIFSYYRNLSVAWDQLTTFYPLFKGAARFAQYLDGKQTSAPSYEIEPDCPVGIRFSIPIENPDDIDRFNLELSKRAFLHGYFDVKQISYKQYLISGLVSIRAFGSKHPLDRNETRQRSVIFFPGRGVDTQKMEGLTHDEHQKFFEKKTEKQRKFADLYYAGVICHRNREVMTIFGEFGEGVNSRQISESSPRNR